MDRGIERDSPSIGQTPERNVGLQPERRTAPEKAAGRDREMAPSRDRALRLSEPELRTLFEIGRFRTVAVQDLSNHRYPGESSKMEHNLASLIALGLVQRRTAALDRGRGTLTVLVLT